MPSLQVKTLKAENEYLKETIRGLEYCINTGQANWLRNLASPFENEKGEPHPAEVWRREMSAVVNRVMVKIEPPCDICGCLWGERHLKRECVQV